MVTWTGLQVSDGTETGWGAMSVGFGYEVKGKQGQYIRASRTINAASLKHPRLGDKMHLTDDLGQTEKWATLAPVILVNRRELRGGRGEGSRPWPSKHAQPRGNTSMAFA